MRGKTCLKWTKSIYLSLNYILPTYRGNVNYYKSVHHPIPTLPVGTGSTLAIFKISKLSFQLSFQIYSFLAQTEGERQVFLEGCNNEVKGKHIARL